MSSASMSIANASGFVVRQKINEALAALASNSSGTTAPVETTAFQFWVDSSGATPQLKIRNAANNAWISLGSVTENLGLKAPVAGNSEPTTPVPFQPWVDTSGANPIAKIRNSANDGWIIIGRADQANYGLLPLAGGTMIGPLICNNTDYIKVPAGTTAQRPSTPVNGMMRYNTDLQTMEIYKAGAWGPVGGGQFVSLTPQTIGVGDTISLGDKDPRQKLTLVSSGGVLELGNTPFGSFVGSGVFEFLILSTSDVNTLVFKYQDIDFGCVGNFEKMELTKDLPIRATFDSGLKRFFLARY